MSPLSEAGRRWLLTVARSALDAAAHRRSFEAPKPPASLAESDLRELERRRAAFVSLHHEGRLRGCVGHTAADLRLRVVVPEMTRAAALEDSRFPAVTPLEAPAIAIEISVLSRLFRITPADIVPGRHGLLVRRGFQRGLLLPQVATTYQWDATRFLEETCRKAGLPRDAWQHGAVVEAFTAEVITSS